MLMGVPKIQGARGPHGATHDHTYWGTGLAKSITGVRESTETRSE